MIEDDRRETVCDTSAFTRRIHVFRWGENQWSGVADLPER